MLRITDVRETMPDGAAVWTLKLQGNIQDEWVTELRRAWQAVRLSAAGASIRIVLGDVRHVDPAGKALLAEMHRDGVEILATDSSSGAVPDKVADRVASPSAPRGKKR